ncbi:hypothetical protein [Rhodovulum kholense]|uniref:hypothetical protein n=1 Tax=Rhodovulum kholense TaxID=453584 RepID=UPI000D3C3902|nr:hypothetical protein [Rhodovulum kholense]
MPQFETEGSISASNRSIQWREKVVEPLFESRPDHVIRHMFAEPMFKHIAVENGAPRIEDITRGT